MQSFLRPNARVLTIIFSQASSAYPLQGGIPRSKARRLVRPDDSARGEKFWLESNVTDAMQARDTVRCMRKHDDCAMTEAVLGKIHRCRFKKDWK